MNDLLTVGFSLQHALHFTKTALPTLAPTLTTIEQGVRAGRPFSTCIAPFVTTDLYYQILLAERHGKLAKAFQEIGTLLATRQRQYRKLRGLLQYPLILLVFLAVVVAGLASFVYPELRTWQNVQSSPWRSILTSILLFCATAVLASVVLFWWRWRRQDALHRAVIKCRLPVVGQCYRLYYGYYLTTNLAILLRHGMSLQEILELTRQFDQSALLFQLGACAQDCVQRGRGVEELLGIYPFVPAELVIFINKGATLAELGADLAAFADIQFKRLTAAIDHLLGWVQPVIFALIAVVIIGLYLSILLPIYHSFPEVY